MNRLKVLGLRCQVKNTISFLILSFSLLSILACARVRVEAPKDPIKVDISMRLDIYQHVEKDIADIEDIVSGSSQEKPQVKPDQSFLNIFLPNAYAQEVLSQEVEQAALRRKDRRPELVSWQQKGVIGENRSGLVEIRTSQTNSVLEQLVSMENSDRMSIYEEVARKNGTSVIDVQKLYSKRLQSDAPTGTPIESLNPATNTYEWKQK